jgi:hypothetical protein
MCLDWLYPSYGMADHISGVSKGKPLQGESVILQLVNRHEAGDDDPHSARSPIGRLKPAATIRSDMPV